MNLGIIICRNCHRALGFELRFKSTKCPYCTTKNKINPKEIKYTTDSEIDLVEKISRINTDLKQEQRNTFEGDLIVEFAANFQESGKNRTNETANLGTLKKEPKTTHTTKIKKISKMKKAQDIYEHLEPQKRIALKFKGRPETLDVIKDLALNLGRELGEFSEKEFSELLLECKFDVNKSWEYLEKLRNLGLLYEPKLGLYKIIEIESEN